MEHLMEHLKEHLAWVYLQGMAKVGSCSSAPNGSREKYSMAQHCRSVSSAAKPTKRRHKYNGKGEMHNRDGHDGVSVVSF